MNSEKYQRKPQGRIADGGTSTVYEVVRVADGAPYAAKMLTGWDVAAVEREIANPRQALIPDHGRRYVEVEDWCVEPPGPNGQIILFLAWQTPLAGLTNGGPAISRVEQERRLSWIVDLASGLELLHAAGTVHSDAHLSNAFVDSHGRARWGDLGLAELHTGPAPIGHPSSCAPSVFDDDRCLAADDRYSLAHTAMSVLAGRSPYFVADGDPLAPASSADSWPSTAAAAGLPRAIDGVLIAACARRREHRPPDCLTFARALTEAAGFRDLGAEALAEADRVAEDLAALTAGRQSPDSAAAVPTASSEASTVGPRASVPSDREPISIPSLAGVLTDLDVLREQLSDAELRAALAERHALQLADQLRRRNRRLRPGRRPDRTETTPAAAVEAPARYPEHPRLVPPRAVSAGSMPTRPAEIVPHTPPPPPPPPPAAAPSVRSPLPRQPSKPSPLRMRRYHQQQLRWATHLLEDLADDTHRPWNWLANRGWRGVDSWLRDLPLLYVLLDEAAHDLTRSHKGILANRRNRQALTRLRAARDVIDPYALATDWTSGDERRWLELRASEPLKERIKEGVLGRRDRHVRVPLADRLEAICNHLEALHDRQSTMPALIDLAQCNHAMPSRVYRFLYPNRYQDPYSDAVYNLLAAWRSWESVAEAVAAGIPDGVWRPDVDPARRRDRALLALEHITRLAESVAAASDVGALAAELEVIAPRAAELHGQISELDGWADPAERRHRQQAVTATAYDARSALQRHLTTALEQAFERAAQIAETDVENEHANMIASSLRHRAEECRETLDEHRAPTFSWYSRALAGVYDVYGIHRGFGEPPVRGALPAAEMRLVQRAHGWLTDLDADPSAERWLALQERVMRVTREALRSLTFATGTSFYWGDRRDTAFGTSWMPEIELDEEDVALRRLVTEAFTAADLLFMLPESDLEGVGLAAGDVGLAARTRLTAELPWPYTPEAAGIVLDDLEARLRASSRRRSRAGDESARSAPANHDAAETP